jgi:hypothetical protein
MQNVLSPAANGGEACGPNTSTVIHPTQPHDRAGRMYVFFLAHLAIEAIEARVGGTPYEYPRPIETQGCGVILCGIGYT